MEATRLPGTAVQSMSMSVRSYWPVHVEAMANIINGTIDRLRPVELLALSTEIKFSAEHKSRFSRILLRRLLANAKMGKLR